MGERVAVTNRLRWLALPKRGTLTEMSAFATTFGVAILVFGLCFAGMAVGLIVRGRRMGGGCGSDPDPDAAGNALGCGACPKKKVNLCDSEDPSGMADIAELATLGRYRETGDARPPTSGA